MKKYIFLFILLTLQIAHGSEKPLPVSTSIKVDLSLKIKVAVLDNGVDYNHPELKNKISRAQPGLDLRENDHLPFPFEDPAFKRGSSEAYRSHGTHVAGIIAKNNDIEIIAVRRKEFSDPSDRQAVEYAISRGARIINMSFGDSINPLDIPWAEDWEPLYKIMQENPKILFIASAGNGYNTKAVNTDIIPSRPGSFNLPNLISVGSVDKNNKIAGDSNFGVNTVLLGALGVDVESCAVNGKGFNDLVMSGTSMAAPQVTRVVSKMLQVNSNLEPSTIIRILKDTVTVVPGLKDYFISGGVLNEERAIQAALND